MVPTFNDRVDIWALGCILFELAIKKRAFIADWHVSQHAQQGLKLSIELPDSIELANRTLLTNIVREMLRINSKKRPGASELRESFHLLSERGTSSAFTVQGDYFLSKICRPLSSDEPDELESDIENVGLPYVLFDLIFFDFRLMRTKTMASEEPGRATSTAETVFSVRYERNPYFTGRDEFLDTLAQVLSDRSRPRYYHRVALYGIGGVGKTQIALAYAYRHKSDYKYVFWISGADETQLLSGFADIARKSKCTTETGKKPSEVGKAALDWLRDWLLIIDNLDNLSIVKDYLPTMDGTGHTLITTRNKNSDGIPAEGLAVPQMNPEYCVRFLLDRCRLNDQTSPGLHKEAHQIVKELGYLPLAVEQAAAYIRVSQNLGEYLATYHDLKRRQELLDWRPSGNNPYYEHTVATALNLSLQRLQSSSPNAFDLIQYFAFMNPDEILVDFIKEGIEIFPLNVQELFNNRVRWVKALKELEKFSLVNVFQGGTRLSIHRLVQVVIQDKLDSRDPIASVVIRLGLQSFPAISDASKREIRRRYRSQVIACLELGISEKYGSEWQILAGRVALDLREDGFYMDCLHWCRLTFDIRTKVLGPEHPNTLQSMNGLASSFWSLGQIKESAQLYEETLAIQRRVLGPEHHETLWSMNGLATSFWSLGQIKEAAQLHEETLAIRRRVLGPEHPETLRSMHGLASSFWSLGQIKEAAQLYEETLAIQRRILGPEHLDTLESVHVLESMHKNLDRLDEGDALEATISQTAIPTPLLGP